MIGTFPAQTVVSENTLVGGGRGDGSANVFCNSGAAAADADAKLVEALAGRSGCKCSGFSCQ